MQTVILRKDAIRQSLQYYYTGKPCPHGHIDIRRAKSGRCRTCSLNSCAKYAVENKEKIAERSRRYLSENKEKIYSKNRQYQKENRKKVSQIGREWRLANIDHCRSKERKRRAESLKKVREYEKDWHRRNPTKDREYKLRWLEKNPGADLAWRANRRARCKNSEGSHTKEDIQDIIRLQKNRCAICRVKMKSPCMDHIIPLSRGGTNFRTNLQAVCRPCNSMKHAKDPVDFARSQGKLL